jgi:hypothetical protein
MLMPQNDHFQKSGIMRFQIVLRLNKHKYFDAPELREAAV